jgi:hypothetical protein
MQVFDHFENWDNFANKCSVSLHAVDDKGTVLWANDTELRFMGYAPEEYIGRFIGDCGGSGRFPEPPFRAMLDPIPGGPAADRRRRTGRWRATGSGTG